MKSQFAPALIATLIAATTVHGTEPNETFGTATVLSPGVLTVADQLTIGTAGFPDTLLGVRDMFGQIYFTDDDGSPLGDGRASGLGGVPTNSGSIDFSVTGYTDTNFDGFHSESGQYKVFVDVYDLFGDPVDAFSEVRTLAPGVVHDFFYDNFEWIGGDYDVYIDNTVGAVADVDFFTFTGLSAGAQFTARTADPAASGIDTFLGWFASGGSLLDSDDDGAGGTLSLIDGTVPAGGMLTFAVTGFGDAAFTGAHHESGTYELRLQVQSAGVPGDYNMNNIVDTADYVLWRDNEGTNNPLPNDAIGGTIGPAHYNQWQAHFGQSAASGSAGGFAASVPEPTTALLAIIAATALSNRRRKPLAA